MSRVWSRGLRRYLCYKRVFHGPKAGHEGVVWHIDANDAEKRIIGLIESFMADPENAAKDMEVYADHVAAANEAAAAALPGLEERLADLIKQEDTVVDLAAAGKITDAQLARKMEKIEETRGTLNAQIAELKADTDFDAAQVRSSWARMIADRLRKGKVLPNPTVLTENVDPRLIKAYIRGLVDLIWLEPDGKLTVEGPINVSGSPSS